MANFCGSIEFEPRTLKEVQLNLAREIAVDIVQKRESDEASTIFNEPLKPVAGAKEMAAGAVADANPTHKAAEELSSEVVKGQIYVKTCCRCSSFGLVIEPFPEECSVKEPFSAPF